MPDPPPPTEHFDGIPAPSFPNLPEEPPATTELLLEELNQVTDYTQQRVPDHPDSLEIAARVQLWLGNTEEAASLWERCLQLNPRYGHAYFGLGSLAAQKGQYEVAADFLRKAIQFPPTSPEALGTLGEALINAGKMEEAIAALSRSPSPPSARQQALLGQAYLQTQNYEAARTHYVQAVNLDPYLSDARYGLAMACGRLGKTDEAVKQTARFNELRAGERKIRAEGKRDYDDVEATRREVARKYTDVGALLVSRGFGSQAEKAWQRAAKLSPQDVNCRQALAWLYRQANKREDAIGMLTQLAELNPNGIEYPLEMGRIHTELGNFDAADQMFQQVRKIAPRDPTGYLAAARLYVDNQCNLPEAVSLAREAVTLEARASNYELLSQALEINGDRTEALAAIEHALKLEPDEPRFQQRHERLQVEQ